MDRSRFEQNLPWADSEFGGLLSRGALAMRNIGELALGNTDVQRPEAASGRLRSVPPLDTPSREPPPASLDRAFARAATALSAEDVRQCLDALPIETCGWRDNRRDPMFARWRLHLPRNRYDRAAVDR